MKKVLSVAMASAMVLGMGANAFAIEYSTGSNDKAAWPQGFAFEGSLFVTDKDDNIVKGSVVSKDSKNSFDFEPGDTIWMPLYADNQKVYNVTGGNTEVQEEVAATSITLPATEANNVEGAVQLDTSGNPNGFTYTDHVNKVVYYYNTTVPSNVGAGWRVQKISTAYTTLNGVKHTSNSIADLKESTHVVAPTGAQVSVKAEKNAATGVVEFKVGNSYQAATLKASGESYTGVNLYYNPGTKQYYPAADVLKPLTYEMCQSFFTTDELNGVMAGTPNTKEVPVSDAVQVASYKSVLKSGVQVVAELPKVEGKAESAGTIGNANGETGKQEFTQTVKHGHYTGNIDKNWSINLIEEKGKVSDLIEKVELYKADAADVTSYGSVTNEVVANGVYLKVSLKDEWKTTDTAALKYYVYLADNNGNKTNKVWVAGNYKNNDFEWVDFDWTNDASKAKLWKVRDKESGTATFDFADKLFFSVKMYGGESMYLDLNTAYDKVMAGEFDAEFDSFYKFSGSNANFARPITVVIVSDDDTLVPYEINEDGDLEPVDAEYVENYLVKNSNKKVNGFKFEVKQLGNYVLSTEELGAEEEVEEEEPEVDEEEAPEVEETPEVNEAPETNKPNPETGAEDFVGLAVSLAVVSVAAAGALALKK